MDERNWWFASKLQETFRFSGYDNPNLLEDFLSDLDVAETISKFLGPGEPKRLFFYCEESECEGLRAKSFCNRQLRVSSQVSKDLLAQGKDRVCLYVLKRDPGAEIDATQMDQELFCGEVRHSVLASLSALLTDAYGPLLRSQTHWGGCNQEQVRLFLQNYHRLSSAVVEVATQAMSHQCLLQHLPIQLKVRLQAHQQQHGGRMMAAAELVTDCEELVADWVSTIEGILIECTDERSVHKAEEESLYEFLLLSFFFWSLKAGGA